MCARLRKPPRIEARQIEAGIAAGVRNCTDIAPKLPPACPIAAM
jgi:hypothetical protein